MNIDPNGDTRELPSLWGPVDAAACAETMSPAERLIAAARLISRLGSLVPGEWCSVTISACDPSGFGAKAKVLAEALLSMGAEPHRQPTEGGEIVSLETVRHGVRIHVQWVEVER